jgi:hypothetical protein
MTTARVISESDIIPNRAAGYRLENGELKNQEWVSPTTNTTADGALYFSILDLAKWDAALYEEIPLKRAAREQMWTPVEFGDGTRKAYGFGWHTEKIKNRRFVYHGGAWQGFKSFIGRFPDDKLTIVIFANSWDAKEFKLARGVASLFYPEFALPAAQPIKDNEPSVTSFIRRTLLQFSADAVDTNLFTPEAQAKIFPARRRRIGEQLNSLSIPIAVVYTNELIERREENGLRFYRYHLNDATRSFSCAVKLTKDDKIADFKLEEINNK